MKFNIILLAVLVTVVQAGQIPPEATVHQVLVPVPVNVLAPPLPETTAVVKEEVLKDNIQNPDIIEQPVTVQLSEEEVKEKDEDITSITPTTPSKQSTTISNRLTRAVPYTDNDNIKPQLATNVNIIKNILNQRKSQKVLTNTPSRAMRSVEGETVTNTPNKSSTMMPSIPPLMNPCDLLCTKFEFDPICATNGLCLHEFPNQCILETYNCRYPSQKFSATKDDRCQMHWLTKCKEEDMI